MIDNNLTSELSLAAQTPVAGDDPTAAIDVSPSPLPRPFGKYELLKLLGRGGMGSVYLARDPDLDRQVAIKIPQPLGFDDGQWRQRFLIEARAAATLNHPHICPVYEVGVAEQTPYMAMAYIEGETLAERLRRRGKFSAGEAAPLLLTIAQAMAEAHEKGIVHRDLKPANVMIDRRGQPVVMDFGLALRSESDDLRLTLSGVAMGTPAYMPPEQAGGEHDAIGPGSDVYSLGVILFEMLSGRLPFSARSFGKLLAQIERDPPPSLSSLGTEDSPALQAIINKCLRKESEKRFANAGALAAALEMAIETPAALRDLGPDSQVEAAINMHASAPSVRAAPSRRGAAIALAAAGMLVLALAAALLFALRGDKDRGGPTEVASGSPAAIESSALPTTTSTSAPESLPPTASVNEKAPTSAPIVLADAPTEVELPGWRLLLEANQSQMREWLDERQTQGHSVSWLDASMVNESEARFAAIASLDGRGKTWQAFLNLSEDEINQVPLLNKRFNAYDYLPLSFSGYMAGDTLRVAALFQTGKRTGGLIGVTSLVNARSNLMQGEQAGLAIRLLRPFPLGNGKIWCSLYFEEHPTDRPVYEIGAAETELDERIDAQRKAGYHPHSVAAYSLGIDEKPNRRFAIAFRPDPTIDACQVHRDLTAPELSELARKLSADGFVPQSLTLSGWNGAVRYATVWARRAE